MTQSSRGPTTGTPGTPPDTFQVGTFGEVTGAHVDELLTDDEYDVLLMVLEKTIL